MLDKESYIIAELLGRQDPKVQSLVWAANNPEMQQTAKELLEGLARSKGLDPQNPPAFGLPIGLSPSDYPVGRAKCGELLGGQQGLSNDDLKGHLGVFGVTKIGKTSLVKLLLLSFTKGPRARPDNTFIILDPNDEYRDLSLFFSPDEYIWLTPDDLKINLLEVPTDASGRRVMSPQQWIGHLRGVLRLLYLNEPSLNKFGDTLLGLYQQRGVLAGGRDHPSLSDLIEALEREGAPQRSDRERAKEKVIDRLRSIRSMLPGLDVQRSRNVHELFGRRSVCLNMAETSDVAIPLIFNLLVLILESTFKASPVEPVRRVVLMEEAHHYLGSQTYKRTGDLMESRGLAVLRALRKSGFSGWVVTQLVSDLDRAVIGNLSSVFCFRLVRNRCIAEAASALGLRPWQQRELAILPVRQAIVRFSRYPDAIPFVPAPESGRGDVSVRTGTAPGPGGAVPPAKPRPACAACQALGLTLSRAEHKVMEAICERPVESILERCHRVAMVREEESIVRKGLENIGHVECAGSVGKNRLFFEPTDKGRDWARSHGIKIPAYHGSVVHEFCRRKTEQKLALVAPGVRFQHRGTGEPGGVRLDSLAVLPGPQGKRLAIQVVVANRPKREATSLLKLCGAGPQFTIEDIAANGAGWIDRVLSVAITKRVQKSLERAVRKQNGGELPTELAFLDMESVLDPSHDISWVIKWKT